MLMKLFQHHVSLASTALNFQSELDFCEMGFYCKLASMISYVVRGKGPTEYGPSAHLPFIMLLAANKHIAHS